MKTNVKPARITIQFALAVSAFLMNACSDFISLDPPTSQIVSQTVFETEGSASSALRGIYSLMMTNSSFTNGGIEEYTGTASDELTSYSTNENRLQFFQNSITPTNSDLIAVFWTEPYKYISNANVIIEGVEKSIGIPQQSKGKLIGEALFIRAFNHFYLTALFGDVPYLNSSDYQQNSTAQRRPMAELLSEIERDLTQAVDLLPANFYSPNAERIQPTKYAAASLLARVYLYQGKWDKAESMATLTIDNSSTYRLLSNLNDVFLANSLEAIWQLKPVIPSTGAPQATLFQLTGAPNSSSRRVSATALFTSSFEPGDKRRTDWIRTFSSGTTTWTYFNKYRTTTAPTEYSMILRLAEQYLIRAEARAQLGKLSESRSDVNAIRTRAGLTLTDAATKETLLASIAKERKVELFGEFGHRWLDLKRSGQADVVMSPLKTGWQSTDALFPIPNSERLLNPNLSQNPGY